MSSSKIRRCCAGCLPSSNKCNDTSGGGRCTICRASFKEICCAYIPAGMSSANAPCCMAKSACSVKLRKVICFTPSVVGYTGVRLSDMGAVSLGLTTLYSGWTHSKACLPRRYSPKARICVPGESCAFCAAEK